MVKATKYNLSRTAKRKGILGHQNKSNNELLRIIYKLKRISENLSKNELNKITKMQILSLNKLTKIERMNSLSLNELNRAFELKSAFDGSYVEYESRGDNDDNLSLDEYLNIIRLYLRDMINNHKAHGEWKIQLVMKINFISSLDDNEFRVMYTKSDNVEIMSGTETSDTINELFKSFFRRYQEGLQTKMGGSSFIFERVDSLYYHLHKIGLNSAGSYI